MIVSEFSGYKNDTKSYTLNPTIISPRHLKTEEMFLLTSNFINELFALPNKERKITHWVDDTPSNILHADFLYRLFPNMKLIHIYRDIRDVISSYKTKYWGGNRAEDIIIWLKQMLERWLEIKVNLPKQCYLELKLEDLINTPEKILRQIFHFIELPFDERVLDIKLTEGHVGRWRKDLSKKEIALVKDELFDTMKKYGYNVW